MKRLDICMVSLAEILTPETVVLDLKGSTRDEVLAELVDHVPEIGEDAVAKRRLLQALIERENLHSTGIGDGVALPHARNALVGLVGKPVLVFGRHARGVPFDSIDGQPAQLFFLIVAPSVREHLNLLARISRLVRDPDFRRALLKANTPQEVIEIIRNSEAKLAAI
jgi:mannitol/fructose-specific phosphotransferase system IIA component (Ntr-type)